MPSKSPLQKIQEAVSETVSHVVADPGQTAAKAVDQLRGLVSLGLTVAGQVADQVAERLTGASQDPPPSAPPRLRVAEEPQREAAGTTPTPADVARTAAKKAPVKKAPPKKAAPKPTPETSPGAKLPPTKTAAKKAAPATKAAAKKTAAKKTPAKKASAKKTPAKKSPAKKTPPASTAPLLDPATTKAVASEASTGARGADPQKG